MAVSQQQIADRLKLSVSTVSRALRSDPTIPAETRARVIRQASDLGYRRRATPVASGRRAIGVFTHHTGGRNWTAIGPQEAGHFMLAGISAATAAHDADMLFFAIPRERLDQLDTPETRPSALREGALGGAVLLYGLPYATVQTLSRLLPCVTIVNKYPRLGVDCIGEDADSSIDALIEHLVGLGHRRIGFLHGASQGLWCEDRFAAYIKAMLRRGLPFDPAIALGVQGRRRQPEEHAEEALGLTRSGVTAWICSNDITGYRLWRIFGEAGLRVPEDVSVAGFDGVEPPPGAPQLTTVAAPLQELGEAAVQRLLFRIEDPTAPTRHIQLACRFMAGKTTAPAPAGS